MRLCYFDAFSGISGDMTVGALLDAGANFTALTEALNSLGTGATFRMEKTKRRGIAATKFHVDGGETRSHRHLPNIARMIENSTLSSRVKMNALAVFQRLGEAEAKVHAVPIEKVHFHEVGAVDSICDIVGACFCLDDLGVEEISASALNVGSGTVNTEHGVLPVPAPATAELISGKPVYARGPEMELTTPTGAALVTTLAVTFGPLPPMAVIWTGYGAGDRDFPEQANVLRVLIGEAKQVAEATTVAVIEANIDDTSPQVLGYAMERLLEQGALDVTMTPMLMKKNRQGTLFTVICKPEAQERLSQIVLDETSTLGLRMYSAERRVQARTFVEINTPYGPVKMKVSGTTASPEYDDCRQLAIKTGVPLKDILTEANFAWLKSRRLDTTK
jgi:uncharacterized protein (TIGR00299 family) protein